MNNKLEKDEQLFWENYLENIDVKNILYTESKESGFEKVTLVLDESLIVKIKNSIDKNKRSLDSLIYASWAVVVSKYTYNSSVIFGVALPESGNILPLKANFKADSKISEVESLIIKDLENIEKYKETKLEDILELYGYDNNLFNNIVSINSLTEDKYDLNINIKETKGIELSACYNLKYFNKEFVEQLLLHFKNIIDMVVSNEDLKFNDCCFLEDYEVNKLINEFNNKKFDFSNSETIYHLVEKHAIDTPDKVALVCRDKKVTYRELNNTVNQLAHVLVKKGLGKEDIVCLAIERSIFMAEAILALWKVGAAYIPLDINYPMERIDKIFNNSKSKYILIKDDFADNLVNIKKDNILVQEYLEQEMESESNENLNLEFDINSLAYVIYTSGSTGEPKGAMIEHLGMMNHIYSKINDINITADSVISQNSSQCFDISVWQYFASLASGGKVVIIPNDIVLDTEKFIKEIINNKVSILEIVPVYLASILDMVEEERSELNLEYVLVTGEMLKSNLVEKWFSIYPNIKMVNAYGPTEASDDITHYIMDSYPGKNNIPIGKTIQNLNIYVVDKAMNLCPVGAIGHICVSGIGVGRGYLNDAERTNKVFLKDKFIEDKEVRMYMTGDLGRWLEDGTLETLGRIDNQVKVNGFRIEIGEIENTLINYDKISETVVLIKQKAGSSKYLSAYYTAKDHVEEKDLKKYLENNLPSYMIPREFNELDEFPLLPSGKINRKAVAQLDNKESNNKKYCQSEMELKVEKLWKEVLEGYDEPILLDDDFFQIGGNSLKVTRVLSKVLKEFNVQLSIKDFFEMPTIEALCKKILLADKTGYVDIPVLEKKEYYELSYYQKRLWFIFCLNPDSSVWNMAGNFEVSCKGDFEKVKDIAKKIIKILSDRHYGLRTGFKTVEGEPVQYILDEIELPLETLDISSLDEEAKKEKKHSIFEEEANTPFDLTKAPVFRTKIIKLGNNKYEVIFNLHHIISDGWSMEILKDEFFYLFDKLSKGEEPVLEPLKIQYKDFAAWHNKILKDESVKKEAHAYWKEKLGGDIPETKIGSIQDESVDYNLGQMYNCFIDNELMEKLKLLARRNNTTLFTVLFSTYNLLVAYFTGQTKVLCGTPAAGREHLLTQDIVGFFINPIPVITEIRFDEDYESYIRRMEEEIRQALNYQNYPIELALDDLKINFPDINIYFDMLTYRNDERKTLIENFEPYYDSTLIYAKYDLYVLVTEYKNGIHML